MGEFTPRVSEEGSKERLTANANEQYGNATAYVDDMAEQVASIPELKDGVSPPLLRS